MDDRITEDENEVIRYDGLVVKIKDTDESNSNNLGRYIDKKSLITVDETLSGEYRRSVLLHECIHMVLLRLGEFDLNNNEGFVERLSNSLFRLLEDDNNKDVLLGSSKTRKDSNQKIVSGIDTLQNTYKTVTDEEDLDEYVYIHTSLDVVDKALQEKDK